jgi:hypothetical protein
MKVFIFYGIFESRWHGKKLKASLRKSGYTIAESVHEADIIIAHSGGCLLIPSDAKAKLIILIGLPHWPGKSLIKSTREKIRVEPKSAHSRKKLYFNVYYMITQQSYRRRLKQAWKANNIPGSSNDSTKIVLIRNQQDVYLHSDEGKKLASDKGWLFKTLPGHHDDLWLNPEPYVELIKEFK